MKTAFFVLLTLPFYYRVLTHLTGYRRVRSWDENPVIAAVFAWLAIVITLSGLLQVFGFEQFVPHWSNLRSSYAEGKTEFWVAAFLLIIALPLGIFLDSRSESVTVARQKNLAEGRKPIEAVQTQQKPSVPMKPAATSQTHPTQGGKSRPVRSKQRSRARMKHQSVSEQGPLPGYKSSIQQSDIPPSGLKVDTYVFKVDGRDRNYVRYVRQGDPSYGDHVYAFWLRDNEGFVDKSKIYYKDYNSRNLKREVRLDTILISASDGPAGRNKVSYVPSEIHD